MTKSKNQDLQKGPGLKETSREESSRSDGLDKNKNSTENKAIRPTKSKSFKKKGIREPSSRIMSAIPKSGKKPTKKKSADEKDLLKKSAFMDKAQSSTTTQNLNYSSQSTKTKEILKPGRKPMKKKSVNEQNRLKKGKNNE